MIKYKYIHNPSKELLHSLYVNRICKFHIITIKNKQVLIIEDNGTKY